MAQDDEPVGLDGLRVEFDDERVVSDAGAMLVATVAERLGIEALSPSAASSINCASRVAPWRQSARATRRGVPSNVMVLAALSATSTLASIRR
jgi:hypothetical protein